MDFTEDWGLYQQGIDYKMKLNLFNTVNRNEGYYAGHQWDGVDTGGLPKVSLNVTKRIINFKVSQVMSDMLTMQFSADGSGDERLSQVASLLTDYAKTTWERLKEDTLNEQGLLDACLTGDAVSYFYWDETIDAGSGVMGDMAEELLDNVCYFPGNTSDPRPNDRLKPLQPYIILAFRKQVADVKEEAEKYGASEQALQEITSDADVSYQAGDMARKENDDGLKCTVILKLWPEDGIIHARKSTRSVVIRPDWSTGLHRYPVAVMNWLPRKNSCHGESEANELIPNNVAINKLMATMILWTMLNAYPKVIYDAQRIDEWNNDITQAIKVEGDVSGVAQYLQPNGLPASVMQLFRVLVEVTKDMAGANETALGDDSVTKTASGIIALQKASALPLMTNKRRFSQWIEDKGLIWLDFWLTHYNTERTLSITGKNGDVMQVPFDGSLYNPAAFNLRIDVGASTQYSDIQAIQTLDNWLAGKFVTFRQYLERIRNFHIVPDVDGLLDEQEQQETMAQNTEILYRLMEMFVLSLPPDMQSQLEALRELDPKQYELQVKQMIMGGGMNGMPGVQATADGGAQQVPI